MTLDHAAARYAQAKEALAKAQANLDDAHATLVGMCTSRNEGAITERGEAYKVTVDYKVNRTIDTAALNALWPEMPDGVRRVFPAKPPLDLKELRHWQNNNPAEYARYIAPAVTAKPGKPGVKVEVIAEAKEAA